MSRHTEKHEILRRGLGELKKSINDIIKRITSCETTQNLLLTAPIFIEPTVFSYRDITMETTSVVQLSINGIIPILFAIFWPFFTIKIPINSCKIDCKWPERSAIRRKQFLAPACQVSIKSNQN